MRFNWAFQRLMKSLYGTCRRFQGIARRACIIEDHITPLDWRFWDSI